MRGALLAGALVAAAAAVPAPAGAASGDLAPKHVLLNRPAAAAAGADRSPQGQARPGRVQSNGISYHGGPVMLGTTNAYVIWYGSWSTAKRAPLQSLLGGIGGSPYFNINTTYTNGSGTRVTNSVALKGEADDAYSRGTALSDAAIQQVVASAISAGKLPADANGVYFVLTDSTVTATSGFLTQYCGWHTHGSIAGKDIKYSFVGDASANLSACAAQTSSSPNGDPAVDAMASVVAHELEEAVSDPDLNAWYDTRGYENADKCAWTFGSTYPATNGSTANMQIGGRDFLIQRNWVNASGGYCALAY